MKLLWICIVLASGLLSAPRLTLAAEALVFTDHAGRAHALAAPPERIAAAGAPAEILLYTLVPERLVGWNRQLTTAARRYIPEPLQPRVHISYLPDAENTSRDADFIALQPQLILDYGSMHSDYAARADAVQTRLKVPFVLLDGRLERIPEVYRALGTLLGVEARAEKLAMLAESLLAKYRGMLAGNVGAKRVYISSAADGLMPVFLDDSSNEVFAWLGLPNVAGSVDDMLQFPIGFSEVANWQPDTIFALAPAFLEHSSAAKEWQLVPAVRTNRVYTAPRLPFDWVARPPSVNRLLGLVWVAMILSPEQTRDAFEQDIRKLFATYLHRELSTTELQELLGTR